MDNVSMYDSGNNTYTNSSNETTEKETVLTLVTFSFCAALSLGTIALNIILIVKLNCRHKHKEFTRFFLTSMAVVDLFVGITVMPFRITNEFIDMKQLFGYRTCSVMNSVDIMLSSASVIHLSILTFERYVAICRQFSYLRLCSRRNMILMFFMCWLLAIIISFGFIMPGLHQYGTDEHILQCTIHHSDKCAFIVNVYYDMICSTLTIFIPGCFILCFNIKVLKRVRHQSIKRKYKLGSASPYPRRSGNNSQSMRIARTIAVLTGCFFICWLPFFIVSKIAVFNDFNIPFIVEIVVVWLGYANSAMNPLLYLLLQSNISCIGKQ